jgi:hypothetical protein
VLEFGYDAEARACRDECPDKKICSLFVSGVLGAICMKQKASETALVCPFRNKNSITARAWMMCTRGILISELIQWSRSQGVDPGRILRVMRAGEYHDNRWRVEEANGYLKIFGAS